MILERWQFRHSLQSTYLHLQLSSGSRSHRYGDTARFRRERGVDELGLHINMYPLEPLGHLSARSEKPIIAGDLNRANCENGDEDMPRFHVSGNSRLAADYNLALGRLVEAGRYHFDDSSMQRLSQRRLHRLPSRQRDDAHKRHSQSEQKETEGLKCGKPCCDPPMIVAWLAPGSCSRANRGRLFTTPRMPKIWASAIVPSVENETGVDVRRLQMGQ